MFLLNQQILLVAAGCVLIGTGCRSTKNVTETQQLLQTVSYETPQTAANELPQQAIETASKSETAPTGVRSRLASMAVSTTESVRNGVVATVGVVGYGVFNVIDEIFFDGDDDADRSTPRGQADQDLQRWMDERDRWEDKG